MNWDNTVKKPLLLCSRRFFAEDERGVTAIEYALIASLIATAIVQAVASTGTSLNDLWGRVANCVTNAANGTTC